MWVQSLGREDPLEEEVLKATHSSILAWKIPWTEEPGGYSPWGHKESDVIEHVSTRIYTSITICVSLYFPQSPPSFFFFNFKSQFLLYGDGKD